MPRPPQKQKTRDRILDVAERLVQTRGFNAFSYADIAEALQVTKASLHYHFPTKADLGTQLIERYAAAFTQALADIDTSSKDAAAKLRQYVDLYGGVLRANRMCLCGMLAAEFATLPKPMKVGLNQFFDANERVADRSAGEWARDGMPELYGRGQRACTLPGGVARGRDDACPIVRANGALQCECQPVARRSRCPKLRANSRPPRASDGAAQTSLFAGRKVLGPVVS